MPADRAPFRSEQKSRLLQAAHPAAARSVRQAPRRATHFDKGVDHDICGDADPSHEEQADRDLLSEAERMVLINPVLGLGDPPSWAGLRRTGSVRTRLLKAKSLRSARLFYLVAPRVAVRRESSRHSRSGPSHSGW